MYLFWPYIWDTIIGSYRLCLVGLTITLPKIYIIGDGSNMFSYISARDVTDACIRAETRGDNKILNIGSDRYGTFREDLEYLVRYADTGSRIVSVNERLARFALMVFDKISVSPLSRFHYMSITKEYVFDISKAKHILGWKPRDGNRDMLRQSYDWYLKILFVVLYNMTRTAMNDTENNNRKAFSMPSKLPAEEMNCM